MVVSHTPHRLRLRHRTSKWAGALATISSISASDSTHQTRQTADIDTADKSEEERGPQQPARS
eukprot:245423-Rhodomonas_salina.1